MVETETVAASSSDPILQLISLSGVLAKSVSSPASFLSVLYWKRVNTHHATYSRQKHLQRWSIA